MSTKNTAIFGIYATPGTAEAAVDHLLAKGFTNSAISVLLPDDESTRAFAHEKNTKAPEGTTTGATAGGVGGGTLGLLAGVGLLNGRRRIGGPNRRGEQRCQRGDKELVHEGHLHVVLQVGEQLTLLLSPTWPDAASLTRSFIRGSRFVLSHGRL